MTCSVPELVLSLGLSPEIVFLDMNEHGLVYCCW